MDTSLVMDIMVESLKVTALSARRIRCRVDIRLVIGVLQAATSIQEMTLSFIPKLAVMLLALVLFGEWQLSILAEHFETIFERVRTVTL